MLLSMYTIMYTFVCSLVLSKTPTHHGQDGVWGGVGQSRAEKDRKQTGHIVQETTIFSACPPWHREQFLNFHRKHKQTKSHANRWRSIFCWLCRTIQCTAHHNWGTQVFIRSHVAKQGDQYFAKTNGTTCKPMEEDACSLFLGGDKWTNVDCSCESFSVKMLAWKAPTNKNRSLISGQKTRTNNFRYPVMGCKWTVYTRFFD